METIDKVTKFGTIAHNLIEETETYFNYIELVSKRKPGMDVIKDIADSSLFNLDAFEHFLQEKRRLDIVSAPVVNMASLGMAGYYGLHNGAITLNAIANMMTDLYARKNRDYGNSFDKSMDKFGLVVAAIRIGDKVNRLSRSSQRVEQR